MKIYAVSGIGADHRVFDFLQLKQEIIPIYWNTPLSNETLSDYAKRLSSQISTEEPFVLLGVSFGGIIVQELLTFVKPLRIILISSVVSYKEFPWLYRFIGSTGIVKILPSFFFQLPWPIAKRIFGTNNLLLKSILNDTDSSFVKWSVDKLLSWKESEIVVDTIRIHGSNDLLIPLNLEEQCHLVKGGGHFAIVDEAKRISEIISNELSK